VNFDDHDWELGHRRAEDFRDTSTIWKVAAGVALGAVLGGGLVFAFERYEAQRDLSEALQAFEQLVRSAEVPAAGAALSLPPAETPREPARPAAAAEPERAPEPARAAAPESAERSAETLRRQAQQAAERKARAWANYYRKPELCDDNASRATMVECANHFIRARRQFEEAYAAGRL
jgi:hypothetical protein